MRAASAACSRATRPRTSGRSSTAPAASWRQPARAEGQAGSGLPPHSCACALQPCSCHAAQAGVPSAASCPTRPCAHPCPARCAPPAATRAAGAAAAARRPPSAAPPATAPAQPAAGWPRRQWRLHGAPRRPPRAPSAAPAQRRRGPPQLPEAAGPFLRSAMPRAAPLRGWVEVRSARVGGSRRRRRRRRRQACRSAARLLAAALASADNWVVPDRARAPAERRLWTAHLPPRQAARPRRL